MHTALRTIPQISLATAALATGGVALAYATLEKRLAAPMRTDPLPRQRPRGVLQWLALAGGLAVLAFFCVAPMLAIVWRAGSASSQAWAQVLDEETLSALWNTLRFSFMALVAATVLGVAHALVATRCVAWRAAAFLPFVVSPVTVAFGLLLLYPQWTASLPLLVAAYAVLAYPFVAKALAAGLDSLPLHLPQAARTLGASPWRTFWRVTLPMLTVALRRGMAFAAATALGNRVGERSELGVARAIDETLADGIEGLLVVAGDHLGTGGSLPPLVRAVIRPRQIRLA